MCSISVPCRRQELFLLLWNNFEFLEGVGHVVTSASLVKLPHQDEIADKLKVNAFFFFFLNGVIIVSF